MSLPPDPTLSCSDQDPGIIPTPPCVYLSAQSDTTVDRMRNEHLLNLRLFPVITATVLVEIHSLQQESSLSLSLWLSSVLESEGPLWKSQSCPSSAWNPGEIVPHFLWHKAANASMWYSSRGWTFLLPIGCVLTHLCPTLWPRGL